MPLFARTRSRGSEAVAGVYPNAAGAVFPSVAPGPELGRRGPATTSTATPPYGYSRESAAPSILNATQASEPVEAAACAEEGANAAAGGLEEQEMGRATSNGPIGHDSEMEDGEAASGPQMKPMQMKVRLSFRTDIGGMAENQDSCFIWRHEPSGSFVIGVLDGHGRDVGQLAAQVVQKFMQDWLSRRWGEVKRDPAEAFRTLFREAHGAMLAAFRQHLEDRGWTVKENEGYLMKRRSVTQQWSCVHGGTSATLVALLEGTTLLTANVGDSSALIAVKGRRVAVDDLIQRSFWKEGGGVMEPCQEPGTVGDPTVAAATATEAFPCQTLLVTADHSPESIREFERMRLTHPANQSVNSGLTNSLHSPPLPKLLVVYDSPTSNKLRCASVFEMDSEGKPRVTGKGRYYKNVRKEWASLVATPLSARFQDALAFTRSIGDFHLQTYGVSHVPDVMSLDLHEIFHRPQGGDDTPDTMLICLVVASDGVWDNWLYSDVSKFFLDPARVANVIATNSAEGATEDFMKENARRAHDNFGSQADNATCVACYLIVSLDA